MEKAFTFSVYSKPYNYLKILGKWNHPFKSLMNRRMFFAYRCGVAVYIFTCLFLASAQLYLSRRDIGEIFYNLSTTLLLLGISIKNYLLAANGRIIDRLRWNLFLDELDQTDPDHLKAKKYFSDLYSWVKNSFQRAGFLFLPIWLGSSLMSLKWGPRRMPYSIWIPFNIDNDFWFALTFFFHAFAGVYVTVEAVQGELCYFTNLVQLATQYRILAGDVKKIKETYESDAGKWNNDRGKDDFRKALKECILRHIVLNKYLKDLEKSYYWPYFCGIILGCILILAVGMDLILAKTNIGVKLTYELGYVLMINLDIFMSCYTGTILILEKESLKDAFYDLPWTELECDTRKDIAMVIIGAQIRHSFRVCSALTLEVSTFLWVIKTMANTLWLFWQLAADS